jgi:hypothetical protein
MAFGYPHSHPLADVGNWLAALERTDACYRQHMNGIFLRSGPDRALVRTLCRVAVRSESQDAEGAAPRSRRASSRIPSIIREDTPPVLH